MNFDAIADLLEDLNAKSPGGHGGKDQFDFCNQDESIVEALIERAAIAQFEGEQPQPQADRQAWQEVCCRTCMHLARPGLAAPGYCAMRTDQPPAYGINHPLHKLPPDFGAACGSWRCR